MAWLQHQLRLPSDDTQLTDGWICQLTGALVGWLEGHLGLSTGASIHGLAGRQSQGGRIFIWQLAFFLQSKHLKRTEWKWSIAFSGFSFRSHEVTLHMLLITRVQSLAQFQQEGILDSTLKGKWQGHTSKENADGVDIIVAAFDQYSL